MINERNSIQKEQQLEKIMIHYGNDLTRLAYTYIKDHSTSKDIVQDVFIKCFHHLDTFRGDASIKTWLIRITINQCKDYLKSSYFKRFKHSNIFEHLQSSNATPDEALIEKDEGNQIRKALLKLPEVYREVIILYYFDELTTTEIADVLNISINSVKTRLRRGRQKLENKLKGGI